MVERPHAVVRRIGQTGNPRLFKIVLFMEWALINVRKEKMKTGPMAPVLQPASRNRSGGISIFLADETWGEEIMDGMIIVKSQAELLETVSTIQRTGAASDLLYRWQKKRRQDCYDRNDDQQFDQRESRSASSAHGIDPCEQPERPQLDGLTVDARCRILCHE